MRVFVLASLLSACNSGAVVGDDTGAVDTSDDGVADTDTEPAQPTDFTATGTHAVDTTSTVLQTADCEELAVDRYVPTGVDDPPLVVLSHGFLRSHDVVAAWARHLASWGVEVHAPDLCHFGFLGSDHPANARDLQAVVDAAGASEVLYVGHSAGGLASYLAAADDDRARAVLGLDPTDADGLGGGAVVTVPHHALFGVPSSCNAQRNFAGNWDREIVVDEADHCDFEDPTDGLCSFACPQATETRTDAEVRDTIRQMLTAWVAWQAGLGDGEAWWAAEGSGYQQLLSDGAISE